MFYKTIENKNYKIILDNKNNNLIIYDKINGNKKLVTNKIDNWKARIIL